MGVTIDFIRFLLILSKPTHFRYETYVLKNSCIDFLKGYLKC